MWTLNIQLTGFPAISKSRLNREHKATWLSVGKEWRGRYLRGHFTHAGARKYGYTLRKGQRSHGGRPTPGSYTWTKLKRQGHTRPLEFYGHSKRLALGQEKLSATRDRVRVRLPQGFNRRHPRSQVRMNEEIRAVTPAEVRQLEGHFKRVLEGRLSRIGVRRTIRAA